MSSSPRARWITIAASALVCFGAASADVPTVTPSEGGLGATVALTGLGFAPVHTPKVRLMPHAGATGLKPAPAKVVHVTATELDVQATHGKAGVYDVLVTPRDHGVAPITLPDTFTLLAPAPSSVEPDTAGSGDSVTIHGAAFGTAKGKVTVGGRGARVKSWTDTAITIVLSKHTRAGAQPVVVSNKAGASDGALPLNVSGSSSGGGGGDDEYLRATFKNGPAFEATSARHGMFNVTWDEQHLQLTFGGTTKPSRGIPNLYFSIIPLDLTKPTPFDIGLLAQLPSFTIATALYTVEPSKIYQATAGTPGSKLAITITKWDGTFVEGDFTGTFVQFGNATPLEVTEGHFRVRRSTGH